MCLPLIITVFQVLAENTEAMPMPYHNEIFFYDPWYYQSMMMQTLWSPYQQTAGPVTFGGPVNAKGAVTIATMFGMNGSETSTSSTPLIITPQSAYPTPSLVSSTTPTNTALPTITALPAVNLPSTTIRITFIDNVTSAVSVPNEPMPFIVVTTTVPNDISQNGNLSGPVKFSGMVPASGRVRIAAHFC